MSTRRPNQRARGSRPRGFATPAAFTVDAPTGTPAAPLTGAPLDDLLNSLEVLRAVHRTFGITDPVALEVAVLMPDPLFSPALALPSLAIRAAAVRAEARASLPATATPAEVDVAALRLLRGAAGLGHVRWPDYNSAPDVPG